MIALQELFYESKDWQLLKEKCRFRFPHTKYFYSGAFGSGLCILSRYPIVESTTWPYSLNGDPVDVGHGDWFVGKAAGKITVKVEKLGMVDVWVTHVSIYKPTLESNRVWGGGKVEEITIRSDAVSSLASKE